LYINEKFFSKGSGETVDIAEEMAARDGLRRLFQTTEHSAPLPFGQRAREFSKIVNQVFEKNLQATGY
jgi:hypothetical protein